jgi:hypothetical protein
MLTVFAIILSVVGGYLFARGPQRVFDPFTTTQNIGGFILVIACVLWVVVFISLLFRLLVWLWVYAP